LTSENLEEASKAMADADASDEISVWDGANQRFHRAITAPCRMPRLLATINELHRADARFLFATWKELDWRARSEQEHAQLLDYLRARKIQAAARTLKLHILEAGKALMEHLGEAK
jgi:DNA-binding GntR family transcriptional regulator